VGAIPLVDVEVDHHRSGNDTFGAQRTDCDCDIVEHAEPFTVRGEGVMRTPRQIHRNAVRKRVLCGSHGPAHRPRCAFHQLDAPRKSEPANSRGVQGPAA
jgi:hypothetical protein